ncbi:ADP-ribose pyrophosphatase [Desulfosarcina alkanivorans]|uniref:GDP-mannose pyrophosphatase n=1 Tax=Desulfosarcina alkanivorans TaxID=571177 RepID=A0A5K7YFZ9_9BACT|nr:NUDIX hydrolase [Desulfosarcina alkanivorans]BBO66980.1 ADP-ribose pyrophosphatase [Desulfosarcina alkanivorans]
MDKAVCNHSTLVRKGRVFDLYAENITLPNGVTTEMEIIRHPGAAAIVALLDDRTVLLVHQYRHAVGGPIWEIPAGTLNPGEDPRRCAQRELAEETGYSASHFEPLAQITPLPAYSDERIHLFLATGLVRATQNLDEDELLSVHGVRVSRAIQMISDGKIQDAKSIAGLQLAAARFPGEKV